MQSVVVKKEVLIERLTKNRTAHKAVVEESIKNYRAAVIKELDAMLEEARAGRQIRRSVKLIEPQDHTSDYDRVLDMLNLSVDDEIELDSHDFARYVRDEWEWFGQFTSSNRSYTMSASSQAYFDKSAE